MSNRLISLVDAASLSLTLPPTPHSGLERDATPVDAASAVPGPVGRSPSASASPILDNEAPKISFQTLLTDDQGNAIPMPNGDHTLDFFFYDTDVGGVPIGEVLNVVVTLDGGVAGQRRPAGDACAVERARTPVALQAIEVMSKARRTLYHSGPLTLLR